MKLIPQSYQTPNAYVDLFLPYLTSDEWRVLTYAIRHIFGWEDKVAIRRRYMSISTFENGVPGFEGCGLSRPTIVNVLRALTRYGLLKKIGEPTRNGQLYELPADSDEVDLEGLKERAATKKRGDVKRTKNARAVNGVNRKLVNETNQAAVNETNQQELMALTDTGKCDIPTQIQHLNQASKVQLLNEDEDPISNAGAGDERIQRNGALAVSPPSSAPPPNRRAEIFRVWESIRRGNSVTQRDRDDIVGAIEEFGEDAVLAAVLTAKEKSKTPIGSWNYVIAVINEQKDMMPTAAPRQAPGWHVRTVDPADAGDFSNRGFVMRGGV